MTCAEQCKQEAIFCYRLLHLGAAVQWCSFVRFVSESFFGVVGGEDDLHLSAASLSRFEAWPFAPRPLQSLFRVPFLPVARVRECARVRVSADRANPQAWELLFDEDPMAEDSGSSGCQQQHEAAHAHPVIRADGVRAARFWRLRAPRSRSQLRPESLSSWQQLQVVAVPGSSFSDPQIQGRPRTSGLMCLKQLVPSLPQPLQSCSREALHRPQAVMAVVAASGAHADVGRLAAA